MRITAILACHNRREQTLRCLTSYFAQETTRPVDLGAVLVDGGSSDGTGDAVRERLPATEVIVGGADLFWAAAMAIAEGAALRESPDHLLWLNDDVVLDPDALERLLEVERHGGGDCISVGAMRDPESGQLSYSGVRRTGWHPMRVELVPPGEEPVEIETFNGNAVLVPRAVSSVVGRMDGGLVHSAADFDYGLRAREAGIRNLLAPGTVGTCVREGDPKLWRDRSTSFRERIQHIFSPKGLPPRARLRYLRRHGGPAWPVLWAWPYIREAPSVAVPREVRSPRR